MQGLEPWLLWMAVGLGLAVLEIVLPGAFLLWLGVAAFGTGIVCRITDLGFGAQVIAFSVLAPLSIALAMTRRRSARPTNVNTPGSGLVGRTATALWFDGHEGRVRLGDSDWPARLVPGSPDPAPMTPMKVVAVDGLVLLVRHADMTQA